MEYKLVANESKFKEFFEKAADAIFIAEISTGIILDTNQAASRLLQMPYKDIIGLHQSKLHPAHNQTIHNSFEKHLEELEKNDSTVILENTVLSADGTETPVEILAASITYDGKKCIMGTFRDITARKLAERELIAAKERAERSEAQLAYSQRVARIGYYIFDIKEGLWTSSEMLDELLGIDSEYKRDVNGWLNLVHPDYRAEMYAYLETNIMKNHEEFNKEYIVMNAKTRDSFWVHGLGNLELDNSGKLLKMFGTIQDISERKQTLEELIKAKEKAEGSDRLKTIFLQNMSHEVRTPLNSIVGFSQLIVDTNPSAEKLRAFSKNILSSSEKLISVVTDVLEISQIQANETKLKLCETNIVSLITTIVSDYTKRANEKRIELLFNQEIQSRELIIISDGEKLKKIFSHLIDNALKFTHHGFVKISCGISGENLMVSISDTGIGIAEETQEIIFEPFRQVETELSRNYGGNGLGLSLVKAYIELFKGKISLKSELKKGTDICVSIPVIRPERAPGIIKGSRISNPVHSILIAEDEYANYLYLTELLNYPGLKIQLAANGKQAVDICKKDKNIGLILMDLRMPIMDGHTAAKLIKGFRPDLPIIAQTAYTIDSEMTENLSFFEDYLTKPISRYEFDRKMIKYIDM